MCAASTWSAPTFHVGLPDEPGQWSVVERVFWTAEPTCLAPSQHMVSTRASKMSIVHSIGGCIHAPCEDRELRCRRIYMLAQRCTCVRRQRAPVRTAGVKPVYIFSLLASLLVLSMLLLSRQLAGIEPGGPENLVPPATCAPVKLHSSIGGPLKLSHHLPKARRIIRPFAPCECWASFARIGSVAVDIESAVVDRTAADKKELAPHCT